MSFERYVVLRNPVSTDASKTDNRIDVLRRSVSNKEFIVINTLPGGRRANTKLLSEYAGLLGERTLLCIAGGDGTVNMALNFLFGDPLLSDDARKTCILPLWAGNANDLAYMLNGAPSIKLLSSVLSKGRIIAIHPLVCRLALADGTSKTYMASNYASFGASGFASKRLRKSDRNGSPMRGFAISRFGLEVVQVTRLLLRAPQFRISEKGQESIIFERVFLNGSRFAKVAAVPLRLTDKRFHRATVKHKSPLTMLFRLADLMRDRAGRQMGSTHDSFTILDTVWAQFDGEPKKIAAGTYIDITISEKPFYALSTKLFNS